MKQSPSDLALFGGNPAFPEALHVGRPNIGDRERLLERINDLLDRRWLTNQGPYVEEFEQAIARHVGVDHCIAICNATIALEIAVRALEFTGEVIVPSFTFVATAHALQWQEITPVFCDVDRETHTIDPERVEELITPRTTGIIGVHLWGRTCDVERLDDIARAHGLRVLYDASHAFGCSHRGRPIGSFGSAEVFSFHATKFVNTFEGGAIVTNDGELADKIRLMRNFGFADYDHVIYIGTNGKMSEVAAAMGITSLESLDEFVAVNHQNYLRYREAFEGLQGVRMLSYDETESCNFQYAVLEIDESEAGLTRDQLQALLWAERVMARRYFYPGCHRMEPYRTYFPNAGLQLRNTELLAGRVLTLPTGTAVGPDDIATIAGIIRLAVSHSDHVRELLETRSVSTTP